MSLQEFQGHAWAVSMLMRQDAEDIASGRRVGASVRYPDADRAKVDLRPWLYRVWNRMRELA